MRKIEVVRGPVKVPKMRLPAGIGTKVHRWKSAYTRKSKHRRQENGE